MHVISLFTIYVKKVFNCYRLFTFCFILFLFKGKTHLTFLYEIIGIMLIIDKFSSFCRIIFLHLILVSVGYDQLTKSQILGSKVKNWSSSVFYLQAQVLLDVMEISGDKRQTFRQDMVFKFWPSKLECCFVCGFFIH